MKFTKYIVAAVVAANLSAPVSASENNSIVCPLFEGLAEQVMKNRQMGVSMSGMMAIFDGDGMATIADMGRSMVIAAYDTPQWNTASNKNRAAVEFKNEMALICWEAID